MSTRPLIATIDALIALNRPAYHVIARLGTNADVIDVRGRTDWDMDKADMVRIIEDDGTYRVLHMTHNEVLRGEIRLSGTMTAMVPAVVANLVEAF